MQEAPKVQPEQVAAVQNGAPNDLPPRGMPVPPLVPRPPDLVPSEASLPGLPGIPNVGPPPPHAGGAPKEPGSPQTARRASVPVLTKA
eukprot:3711509-Prymnesium_polylepis.1